MAGAAWDRGRMLRRRRQAGITTASGLALAGLAAGVVYLGGGGSELSVPPPADRSVVTSTEPEETSAPSIADNTEPTMSPAPTTEP